MGNDCILKASVSSYNKQTFLVIVGDTVLVVIYKVIDFGFGRTIFFVYKPCYTKSYISKFTDTYFSGV